MKKFNISTNGILISTETKEELYPDLSENIKKEIDKLELGETYEFKTGVLERIWEIERVL